MVNVDSNNNISMYNGDTANINIRLDGGYVPTDDDKLIFGMKNNINSIDYLLFKEMTKDDMLPGTNDVYVLSITSEESNSVGIGTFIYDIELRRPSLGTIDTVVKPSNFTVLKGVVENKVNSEGVE